MRIKLEQIKLSLEESLDRLPFKAAKVLGVPAEAIDTVKILRESVDARKKDSVRRVYTLAVGLRPGVKPRGRYQAYQTERYEAPASGEAPLKHRPVVVGFGPAGMMAAYLLAQQGYRPLVLERGQAVEARTLQVQAFWDQGLLDPESNVQFGEGGAGAFSDGKLTCRSRDLRSHWFFQKLVEAGAPPEILYQAKPHVGTDQLTAVVAELRRRIIAMGGEIRFGQRVETLLFDGERVLGVRTADGTEHPAEAVILAVGHSARDTFTTLAEQGVAMTAKPFAVGFRIEHPQGLVDEAQYGPAAGSPVLGPADYHLTHQASEGRAVYTFCMCPGGHVVGAASEPGRLVVNGMSYHARDAANANSALLVTVGPSDFEPGPLGGVAFQRRLEEEAFRLGGGGYAAPVQRVGDYLAGVTTTSLEGLAPSYRPAMTPADLSTLLPEALNRALREGLQAMEAKLKGFTGPAAVLTGIETRSSSPVRINRDTQTLQSVSHPGLYPAGEGAGYAGGIVSSAVDGMLAAESILRQYRRPD